MGVMSQHVVPNDGKWQVRKSGAVRATGTYPTQSEAIARGRELARNQRSVLYIHGTDGRIRERISYDAGPPPSKM